MGPFPSASAFGLTEKSGFEGGLGFRTWERPRFKGFYGKEWVSGLGGFRA